MKRLVLALIVLILFWSASAYCKDTGTLKYFGFAFSGDYIDEVAPFSNVVHIITNYAPTYINQIREASNRGLKVILDVSKVFFYASFSADGQLRKIGLRHAYATRWRNYAEVIRPYTDSILGVMFVDEPYWHAIQTGISICDMKAMVNTVIEDIKSEFPDMKVMGTIALTKKDLEADNLLGYPVPAGSANQYDIPNYDIVAVYYYYFQWVGVMFDNIDEYQTFFTERFSEFEQAKHKGQQFFLIPGAAYFDSEEISETELARLGQYFLSLGIAKDDVIGLFPFLWQSLEGITGTRDLPYLRMEYEDIGYKIID